MTLSRTVRLYLNEIRFEFLSLLRLPSYSLSVISFPLVFYIFFGVLMPSMQVGNTKMARYLLGTYGAFAVMGATLYALGVGISVERGLGWLTLKRASPMPPSAHIVAKATGALLFSVIVLTLLFTTGALLGGVVLSATEWLRLGLLLVAGSVPFILLGLALGWWLNPKAAPGAVNLLYLPMSFLSGLWVPIQMLPDYLQSSAPLLPAYHLGQIGLSAANVPIAGDLATHFAALAGFALLFGGLAWFGQSRNQERMESL